MTDAVNAKDALKYGLRGLKEEIDYNWHGKMIKIRYLLPYEEEVELVHKILGCCGSDEGEGYIIPEMMELATRANIVAAYTNVTLPETIEEQHMLLYTSDLYDVVLKNANAVQTRVIATSVQIYVKGA